MPSLARSCACLVLTLGLVLSGASGCGNPSIELTAKAELCAGGYDHTDVTAKVKLTSGPAKLCQAMAISRGDDGVDLVVEGPGLRVVDDGLVPPTVPATSGRVGIRHASQLQWRFWVPGDPNVSRPRVPGAGAGL